MPKPNEEEVIEFTSALGSAVAHWGKVEAEMYLFYMTLCADGTYPGFPNAYSVIYETIISIGAKLSIVDALAKFKITDEAMLKEWATLENKIRRKIRRVRDKLAHWQVWRGNDTSAMPIFLHRHLYIPSSQIPGFGTAHGDAMGTSQLQEHAINFRTLSEEISAFRVRVRTLLQTTHVLLPAPPIPLFRKRKKARLPQNPSTHLNHLVGNHRPVTLGFTRFGRMVRQVYNPPFSP